jgi:hypothetical protein
MERTTVVGVFRNRDDAEHAIDELHRLGFRDDEIGFAVRGSDHTTDITTTDKAADTGSGALSGAIAGAGIGGFIAAAASLLIPGFGPVVAGGILATLLGGAAVGAAAGGILGALVGLGVPEEEARYYESEFHEGRIIVTVKAGARVGEVRDILYRHGAYDVERRGGLVGSASGSTMRNTGSTVVTTDSTTLHSSSWDETSPRMRERWQSRYGTGNNRWEDIEPYYHYGYEMSHDTRFVGRDWDDVEMDLRRDYPGWGERSGYQWKDTDWEVHREQVRDAWDEARGTRRAA